MRGARVTVAALLVVAACAPAARSAHAGGCGGDWSGSATCQFYVRGLPITLFADARVSSGTASVDARVDVIDLGMGARATLLSCHKSASGYAVCDNEIGAGPTVDSTKQLFLIVCHVQGRGSGVYDCMSGLGF